MANQGNNKNNNQGGNNNGQNNNQNQNNNNQSNQNNQQDQTKTYTENELNVLLAEKRVTAKNEFLKSIGFEGDEEGLKATLERVMEEDKKNQTELDQATKELDKVRRELAAEKEQRKSAESKLEALKLGAKPETVDDLVILASAKVTEGVELPTILSELKKTYPVYFNEEGNNGGEGDGSDGGTKGHIGKKDVNGNNNSGKGDKGSGNGNNGGNGGNGGGEGQGGKSLAERLLAGRTTSGKSNYFKNKI